MKIQISLRYAKQLPPKPEESGSATPTKQTQIITPTEGAVFSDFEVAPIPAAYQDVTEVDATAADVRVGKKIVDSTGTVVAGGVQERSSDVEVSDLTPVTIPAGIYDGSTTARLSAAAAAEVNAQYILQGHRILGVHGQALAGEDTLGQLSANELTSYSNSDATDVRGYLFTGCTSLEEVSFPNAISIGGSAFSGCTSLEEVNFPSVTSIGNNSFENCTGMTEINFPNVTSIGNKGFHGCNNVTSVSCPNLTTLNSYGFNGCSNVTELDFPKLVSIQSYEFVGCNKLRSINLPKLQTMAYSSFYNSPITHMSLPSLVSASGYAVYQSFKMPNLEVLDLGEHVTSLSNAFGGAPKMATVIIRATSVPTLVNAQFGGTPFDQNGSGGTLYVPQNLISTYQSATNWSAILAYPHNQILPIEGSQYEV